MKSDDRRERSSKPRSPCSAYGDTSARRPMRSPAASVSQPYVVRLFGTKEDLFLAALERARRG